MVQRRRTSGRPGDLAGGRWLGDLGVLTAAEQALVDACAAGKWCRLSLTRPEEPAADRVIRAEIVRFLALGGDGENPVHEAGVQVQGAWIAGTLRLSSCEVVARLNLLDCVLDQPLHAYDARLRSLNLAGSASRGLRADRVQIAGGLFLHRGFEADAPVSLAGATIGGDVDCRGSRLRSAGTPALDLTNAAINGQLLIGDRFEATGQVRLIGTDIASDLVCTGGSITTAGAPALAGDGAHIGGNLLIGADTHICGETRLAGAAIDGHLWLEGASLDNPDGVAIQAENARIGQALILRDTKILGRFVLTDAETVALADDADSWPAGRTVLDGFRYQRISSHAVDADARIMWLENQVPSEVGERFRPQPWEQLTRVLRDMGHAREATLVAIAKQRALRRAGQIGSRVPRKGLAGLRVRAVNCTARLLHDAYGLFAGFGHRPERIGLWITGVWLAGGLFYTAAADAGIMAPSEPTILIAALDGSKRPKAVYGPGVCGVRHEVEPRFYWGRCPGMPSEYPHFNGWLYAADLALPVVDFRQFNFWAPAASFTDARGAVHPLPLGAVGKTIQWLVVLFGWSMSLLFGAIMTRLVERD